MVSHKRLQILGLMKKESSRMMEQWNFWFGTRDGQLDVYEGEKEYISNGMDGLFTLNE